MKIRTLLIFCASASLLGCATQTPAPVDPVNWTKITQDVDDILAPRPVAGPIQNRGQAETGQALWDLSLELELAHDGSEGDKARGRAYLHDVAKKAIQLQLPACTLWLRFKRTPCDKGD
jgi:hypothetical protein